MTEEQRALITELNEYLPDYLVSYLGVPVRMKSPDKSENFPCITPDKHAGGTDSKPSMGIHRRGDGSLEAHCFTCGTHLDLLDVIKEFEGVDSFTGQLEKACELFNVDPRRIEKKSYSMQSRAGDNRESSTSDKASIDLTREMEQAHSSLSQYIREEYFQKHRGLSNEVIDRFKLGHFSKGLGTLLKDHPGAVSGKTGEYQVILPFLDENGKCFYLIAEKRQNMQYAIYKGSPMELEKPEAPYRNLNSDKAGRIPLWNAASLKTSPEVIAVTEGIYDALSLETLGVPSIALCGVTNVRNFQKALMASKPESAFLLALDNDDAGKKAQKEIKGILEGMGIPFAELSLEGLAGKDPNEVLKADRAGLEQALEASMGTIREKLARKEADRQALESEIEQRENRERELYLQNTPYRLLENYLERKRRERIEPIPTGIHFLDHLLDGGYTPGLIILGAVSSLGKTTFALQTADHAAMLGYDVLFLSLEMDKEEIADKSISRCSAIESEEQDGHVHNGLTLSDLNIPSRYKFIEQGAKKAILEGALERYKGYCKRIFIKERQGSFSVSQVRQSVEDHIKYRGRKPVVFVDYLQIMDSPDVRLSDKQAMDKTVSELRSISKDYGIPVIVISSFNRASYEKEASFQSFKESGSIEYSSDVLLALEYIEDRQTNEDYLNSGSPIPIKFTILKNRKGRKGAGEIGFYPQFNYFCEY